MIVAICPRCHSGNITLPNRYREKWMCRICGHHFEKPKMIRVSLSDGDRRDLDRQFAVVRQELASAAEAYIRQR